MSDCIGVHVSDIRIVTSPSISFNNIIFNVNQKSWPVYYTSLILSAITNGLAFLDRHHWNNDRWNWLQASDFATRMTLQKENWQIIGNGKTIKILQLFFQKLCLLKSHGKPKILWKDLIEEELPQPVFTRVFRIALHFGNTYLSFHRYLLTQESTFKMQCNFDNAYT